jgi:hypothetical protein
MLAGSLARMSGAIIMCPADTIKTRIQFQGGLDGVKKYTSGRDALFTIWKEEGLIGFARGLPARLVYVAPSAGVSFFFYETIVAQIRAPTNGTMFDQSSHPWITATLSFAGLASARVLGSALRTPFDIIKQRMQIQSTLTSNRPKYKNTFDASLQIARKEGILSLFSSVHAAVLRDAPFAVLYYSAYEVMKDVQRHYLDLDKNERLGRINNFIGGACAGAFAAICTNPLDVVKTRIQTQTSLPKEQWRYNGVIDAIWKIATNEGIKGFSIGLVPRILYITPSAAIIWTCYEAYKELLHRAFASSIPPNSD